MSEATKRRFSFVYAYNVPFYLDFDVEADTEAEAQAIAEAALADRRFDDSECEAMYSYADDYRVWATGEVLDGMPVNDLLDDLVVPIAEA